MVKFIQLSFMVTIIAACGGGGSSYSGVPQAPNSAPYFVDFPDQISVAEIKLI